MANYSCTMWWSKWEVQNQFLEYFKDVEGFLRTNADLGPASRSKLLAFLFNAQKNVALKLELAAVTDDGEKFVRSC